MSRSVAENADRPDQRMDCTTFKLTLKVALIIGSQLICWIPFILTVLYFEYVSTEPASPMVFEVFALMVIPINSLLNPVFYSELYKRVGQAAWVQWRLLVNFLTPMSQANNESTEMN